MGIARLLWYHKRDAEHQAKRARNGHEFLLLSPALVLVVSRISNCVTMIYFEENFFLVERPHPHESTFY